MKAFDLLAKALGSLLLLLVMALVPLLLVGQRTLDAVQDADLLSTAVERYWLNDAMLVKLGRAYAEEQLQQTPPNDRSLVFWRAVATFDDEQWRTLMGFLAPKDVLSGMIGDAAAGFVEWLRTPNASPEVGISLVQWKQSVQANSAGLTNWFLRQFRSCNVVETAQWGEALLLNDWSLPPLCMPLGAPRQILLEGALVGLHKAVNGAPDHVTLLDANRAAALVPMKDALLQAEARGPMVWGGLAFLWLLGLALVSRSWSGLLRAAGSSVLWSGFDVAATTFAISPLSAEVMQHMSSVPSWALASLRQTVDFYLQHILLPLRVPAVVAAVLGGLVWLLGTLLEIRRRKAMADTLDRIM